MRSILASVHGCAVAGAKIDAATMDLSRARSRSPLRNTPTLSSFFRIMARRYTQPNALAPPVVVAGSASSKLRGGRYFVTLPHTPTSNLLFAGTGKFEI
jgi:hypothetical protein